MPFDWTKDNESGETDKLTGYHYATIVRVIRESKKGEFKSRGGDPQLMIVFAKGDAEAAAMFTLSDKAGWTLRRLLSRCGVDLDELNNAGIEPTHFANKAYAQTVLVGRDCWINVVWEMGGSGKRYAEIQPYHDHELPDDVDKAAASTRVGVTVPEVDEDPDIPF